MARDLSRLLRPRSIAVIGGGSWCDAIIGAAGAIGFAGEIIPVHPKGKVIAGKPALRSLCDCQVPIDVAFVGVNRHETVRQVQVLSEMKAGGAVCFASGFTEARAEDAESVELQARLLAAAGDMPILGPNCYGYINALDQCAIWPDQHGMVPVDRGVAVLTQSSNIAINLTMQQRALPIAYMVTCGNMAQTSQAEIAMSLLDDPRVSAIGVHVEGFGNLREWEQFAKRAHEKRVPVVALKIGRSDQARAAAISHTASLAGCDAGAQAFLDRLGFARISTLPEFVETLKLLHCAGPLGNNRIASISCSGGEASLIADMAIERELEFPALSLAQKETLKQVLGPMVSLANPLDYHTYIWRDSDAMGKVWAAMASGDVGMTLSIVDYPYTDATDWACATRAAVTAKRVSGKPFAVVATLPELMPLPIAKDLLQEGVVPFCGLDEALAAIEAAASLGAPCEQPVLLGAGHAATVTLTEAEAKLALAQHGLDVPGLRSVCDTAGLIASARDLTAPFVLKGLGLAHKSECSAVRLGLSIDDLEEAARSIDTAGWLVEEMIVDGIAELLVGVFRDDAHGFILTLGAGGVLTELLDDTVSLIVPASPEQIAQALQRLRIYPVLMGYRGKNAVDMAGIQRAVAAVQDYVIANADTIGEVEINPLICTAERAIAVDALIRKGET